MEYQIVAVVQMQDHQSVASGRNTDFVQRCQIIYGTHGLEGLLSSTVELDQVLVRDDQGALSGFVVFVELKKSASFRVRSRKRKRLTFLMYELKSTVEK